MATKRAIEYSRASVKKAIEQHLEDGEGLMSQHVSKPSSRSYRYFEAQNNAVAHFALKLGFDCMCTSHSKKSRAKCECKAMKGGIRKGHQILSGLGGGAFTFDGKRCRDSQGAFVPVAQCRGRVVGRDKKGKFVSMKG